MKNFIYVAGVDYHPIAEGKTPMKFALYCRKRQDSVFQKQKINKEDLLFYIVDIHTGKIELTEYKYDAAASLHKKTTSTYQTFDPVTQDNYKWGTGKFFHPKGKNIISKYTIYDLVEKIGTDNPGTLEEWGIFSHAYYDGPILVDSFMSTSNYTDPVDNTTLVDVLALGKDPNDYDMRRWDLYYYYGNAANATKLAAFQAALSTTGMLKIYGCSFPKILNAFLSKVMNHATYKKATLSNDDIFNFSAGALNEDMLIKVVNNELKTTYGVKDAVSLTFREIKQIMGKQILYTYCYGACLFLNKNVQGAVPATYADTVDIMKISSKTFKNLEFFKKHFGIKTDDENLNYGIYEPAFDLDSFLL